ncbi:MAG: methyltransferase domain-containing protein [Patescibacteria group bacterium]
MKLTNDVILSKKKWEVLHTRENLRRNLTTDPTVQSYWQFLARYKKHWRRGTVLDLGCGVAFVASVLAKEGAQIVGIDIAEQAIIKSRKLFKERKVKGKFIQGDLLHLPFRTNSFNFIWSCMSLEYVRDTQQAVKEAYRVLNKKGTMVAVVPVVSFTTLTYHQLRGDLPNIPLIKQIMEWFHLKLMKGKFMAYGYEQSFTPGQLRRLFEGAGFGVNAIDYFPMHYPIAFIPALVRPFVQSVLRFRPFWPLVYIETVKP